MHYAHQQGIVHRDLKPANILMQKELTAEDAGSAEKTTEKKRARPKLSLLSSSALSASSAVRWTAKITDFGLAKQLDADVEYTRSGAILGTPSYMAPEQALGRKEAIGPCTDVYGLGAILYEALTGRPPFQGPTLLETLEQVRSQEPVSPRSLQPKLPRDLETICLKCLQKEPHKRYSSAEALAEDLRRFKNHEPIQARPVSHGERLWRWCRREPALAGLTAALVLLAAGAFIAVTCLWLAAERNWLLARDNAEKEEGQRHRAEINLSRARRAVRDHFILVSEEPGTTAMQRKRLQTALNYFQDLCEQGNQDPGLLGDVAEAYYRVGIITEKIASKKDALAAFLKAQETYQTLLRDEPDNSKIQLNLANSWTFCGNLQHRLGRPSEALRFYQYGHAILQKLADAHPDVARYQIYLATNYHDTWPLQFQSGQRDQALDSLRKAEAIVQKLAIGNPSESKYGALLAIILNSVARFHKDTDRPAEALRVHEAALAIRDKLARENPSVAGFKHDLAETMNNMAMVYAEQGDRAEAVKWLEKVLPIREKLARDNPLVTVYQEQLVDTYNNIGAVKGKMGSLEEQLALLGQALDVRARLVRENPSVPKYQSDWADSYFNMGLAHYQGRHWGESRKSHQMALDIKKKLVERYPTIASFQLSLAASYHEIGFVDRELGQFDQAIGSHVQARAIQEKLSAIHPDDVRYQSELGLSWGAIGFARAQQGRGEEAVSAFQKAIGHQRVAFAKASQVREYRQRLSMHYCRLAAVQRDLGRAAEAAAASLERRRLQPDNPAVLWQVACELALCAHSVAKGRTELSTAEQSESQRYLDQARETLWQAIQRMLKRRSPPD
jgi:serine/threonine-protein kinase